MILPTILFGILLSTLYGAVFHFLRGGNARKLLIYLLLAWTGFWAGDSLGWYIGWTFWSIGVLNAGTGTIGSLTFLLIGDLLSQIKLPSADEEK